MPPARQTPTATVGPVLVIGAGLIGTSLALGLRSRGVTVWLQDGSPTALALAVDMGAGQLPEEGEPSLVVVAAPPDVAGSLVAKALIDYPNAVVTDVASVKAAVLDDVLRQLEQSGDEEQLDRYVGSHPMAGRARSGPANAHGDLFHARPWVLAPTSSSGDKAQIAVRDLALDLGAVPVTMDPAEHDRAVAAISHVPQLMSSLLAASLVDVPAEALSLAGQGLRDSTRTAASDPDLWTGIIAHNLAPVHEILTSILEDLTGLVEKLGVSGAQSVPLPPGATWAVNRVVAKGNQGVARIPGKHGGLPRRWESVDVLVPDEPGELGRLFSELGDAGVNIEDLTLDHSANQPVGLARLMVLPQVLEHAIETLRERGWKVAGGRPK